MIYAQLYHLSTGYPDGIKKPIEMCGSDGIVHIDGRYSLANMINLVQTRITQSIRKDEITGFVIHRGPRYTQSTPITKYIPKSQEP